MGWTEELGGRSAEGGCDAEEDDDGKNNRGAAMSPACPVSASFSGCDIGTTYMMS